MSSPQSDPDRFVHDEAELRQDPIEARVLPRHPEDEGPVGEHIHLQGGDRRQAFRGRGTKVKIRSEAAREMGRRSVPIHHHPNWDRTTVGQA